MSPASEMEHRAAAESLPAYVLGALPDDERARIDEHLTGCATCRHEMADLQIAADLLPGAAEPVVPPPELKSRIMSIVTSEAELLQAAGARADRPTEPTPAARRARGGFLSGLRMRPALVGLACALVIGAGIVGFALGGAGDGTPSSRSIAASISPSLATPAATASLTVSGDDGRLEVAGLPNPTPGRVYQVWIKRPGRSPDPTDALFTTSADGGKATVSVPGSLAGADAVLVTAEPIGGSLAPTREPVITASLS